MWSALRTCDVGCAGVVFGLMVVDNTAQGPTARGLLARAGVPAPLAFWALMALAQVVVPGASLLGDLAGLLAGEAWAAGLLEGFALSDAALAWAEAHPLYQGLARAGGAVAAQLRTPHVWESAQMRTAGARAGCASSSSSLVAAWVVAQRWSLASWARMPPQLKVNILEVSGRMFGSVGPHAALCCGALAPAADCRDRWLRRQPMRTLPRRPFWRRACSRWHGGGLHRERAAVMMMQTAWSGSRWWAAMQAAALATGR
jgi:hypothetical protein